MNYSSAAANRAAIKIRQVPFGLADTLVSLFGSDAADKERAEQMILNKLAQIIDDETHCGILLRIAEAAKEIPYANQTDELHQALSQWEQLTKPKSEEPDRDSDSVPLDPRLRGKA